MNVNLKQKVVKIFELEVKQARDVSTVHFLKCANTSVVSYSPLYRNIFCIYIHIYTHTLNTEKKK